MKRALGFLILTAFFILTARAAANPPVIGEPRAKAIVITFDDGPREEELPEILDFLEKEEISAAFFFQCWQAEQKGKSREVQKRYHDLVRRAAKTHEIANHTYGHILISEWLPRIGKKGVFHDIQRCTDVIHTLTGRSPQFFRPRSWVIAEKYKTGWRVDPKNPTQTLCGETYPAHRVFKEELICRGYHVQVLDDTSILSQLIQETKSDPKLIEWSRRNPQQALATLRERAARVREVRDVNTLDYEFHTWHVINSEPMTRKLFSLWAREILGPKTKPEILTSWYEKFHTDPHTVTRDFFFRWGRKNLGLPDREIAQWYRHYQKNPKETLVHLLVSLVERAIARREQEKIRIHVLVFHEREVGLKALKILVPKWRAEGYEFHTLRWVWGMP